MRERVARRVKELRQRAGMSQQELARLAKVSRSFLVEVEQGHRSPNIDLLEKLAVALEVDARELLGPAPAATNPRKTESPARDTPRWLGKRVEAIAQSAEPGEIARFEAVALAFFKAMGPGGRKRG